ncbi:hypothetical protein J6590_030905 [Homalodisca vitripennis]|nr:hypothetical protein J6590_030905 [Homalodisca vitripennis]
MKGLDVGDLGKDLYSVARRAEPEQVEFTSWCPGPALAVHFPVYLDILHRSTHFMPLLYEDNGPVTRQQIAIKVYIQQFKQNVD